MGFFFNAIFTLNHLPFAVKKLIKKMSYQRMAIREKFPFTTLSVPHCYIFQSYHTIAMVPKLSYVVEVFDQTL